MLETKWLWPCLDEACRNHRVEGPPTSLIIDGMALELLDYVVKSRPFAFHNPLILWLLFMDCMLGFIASM